MKPTIIRFSLSAAWTACLCYLGKLSVPLILLFCAVLLDYATGMVHAYMSKTLNSQRGWLGILKKLCYFAAVCVGAGLDCILSLIAGTIGFSLPAPLTVSVFVAIWLIINEAISILENLVKIGVPVPSFLERLTRRLKVSVEQKAAAELPPEPDDTE